MPSDLKGLVTQSTLLFFLFKTEGVVQNQELQHLSLPPCFPVVPEATKVLARRVDDHNSKKVLSLDVTKAGYAA